MLLVHGVREIVDGIGERDTRLFRLAKIPQGTSELQVRVAGVRRVGQATLHLDGSRQGSARAFCRAFGVAGAQLQLRDCPHRRSDDPWVSIGDRTPQLNLCRAEASCEDIETALIRATVACAGIRERTSARDMRGGFWPGVRGSISVPARSR